MTKSLETIDPDWAWSPFEPSADRPWDRRAAAHLFRRAGFAATWLELEKAIKQTPTQIVQSLVAGRADAAFDRELQTLTAGLQSSRSVENLSAWWLYRMRHTPDPLLEKLTLFWHGHFATSAAKVANLPQMLQQNELLRKHARGRFGDMVQGVSRDPAMLIYLDSATNRKVRPNENYARELLELFCMGLGPYTEKDVQEAARAFSGWEVRGGKFRFNRIHHDEGQKTVLGRSGNWDGDDVVRIVLEHPAAGRFIAEKLVRYFVCDEPPLPERLIEPLAEDFRKHDFEIGRAVGRILASNFFFSEHAVGRKVRSPVEFGVGLVRALEGQTDVYELAKDLDKLGQAVFFPPNVKGWDGGRTWINSSTMIGRANLVHRLLYRGDTRLASGQHLSKLADRCGANSPEKVVDWLEQLLLAAAIPAAARQRLVAIAASKEQDRERALADTIHALATLPEFQLG
jgi:uncharacterized protein (DUF1800 family)